MDYQIERKMEIVERVKEKYEKNELTQELLKDMQQEINRCNHIQKHILRSQYNTPGRFACGILFGVLANFFVADRIPSLGKVSFKNNLLRIGATVGGFIIGYTFIGARKFSNAPDYKKNYKTYMEGLKFDKEVEPIMKQFKI